MTAQGIKGSDRHFLKAKNDLEAMALSVHLAMLKREKAVLQLVLNHMFYQREVLNWR